LGKPRLITLRRYFYTKKKHSGRRKGTDQRNCRRHTLLGRESKKILFVWGRKGWGGAGEMFEQTHFRKNGENLGPRKIGITRIGGKRRGEILS